MKTTDALAVSMRRLLANLHPPSPPTAREGQQLLHVLQSSFKNRLDEQHPSPASHEFWPKIHDDCGIPIHKESTSSHATNIHVNSILTNPLLGSPTALHTREDVVSTFEKLTAVSPVDVGRVVNLLRWYTREIKAGRQRQHGERIGDRLNSWLHTTKRSSREAFLIDQSARVAALDLFANEGNEAVVWTWLRLIYERRLIHADISSSLWLDAEDHFVSGLMRLSIRRGNFTEAAQQFLEACQYRSSSARAIPTRSPGPADSNQAHRMLRRSGKRIVSAIVFHRQNHGISPALFSQIYDYLPSWQMSPGLNYTFCDVYRPDKPTAAKLFSYLRDAKHAQSLRKQLTIDSKPLRQLVMTTLLDASKLALDEDERYTAKFLLDFAVESFPEYLPESQQQPLEDEIPRYLELIPG